MNANEALKVIDARFEAFQQKPEKIALSKLTQGGQTPYVTVVTCSDSRVAPEILFGAGLGELFVVRTAGNLVGPHALASIEYATLALNVPLILIVGHSSCGAVSAAVDFHQHQQTPATPSLENLVKTLEPAVASVVKDQSLSPQEILDRSVKQNILNMIDAISQNSPKLKQQIDQGELAVHGALLDMEQANLEWLTR